MNDSVASFQTEAVDNIRDLIKNSEKMNGIIRVGGLEKNKFGYPT